MKIALIPTRQIAATITHLEPGMEKGHTLIKPINVVQLGFPGPLRPAYSEGKELRESKAKGPKASAVELRTSTT